MNAADSSPEEQYTPRQYEIRLKGLLDARWADRFEGLSLAHTGDGITILSGLVVDQAALYGLLRTVRDLGLPLISVMQVEPGQAGEPDAGARGDHPRSSQKTGQ